MSAERSPAETAIPPEGGHETEELPPAVRLQILTAEQSSLAATRALAWNEFVQPRRHVPVHAVRRDGRPRARRPGFGIDRAAVRLGHPADRAVRRRRDVHPPGGSEYQRSQLRRRHEPDPGRVPRDRARHGQVLRHERPRRRAWRRHHDGRRPRITVVRALHRRDADRGRHPEQRRRGGHLRSRWTPTRRGDRAEPHRRTRRVRPRRCAGRPVREPEHRQRPRRRSAGLPAPDRGHPAEGTARRPDKPRAELVPDGLPRRPRLHSADASPRPPRPARRARRRGLPGRSRAHGHRGRPAVDPARPLGHHPAPPRGLDRQRLPARLCGRDAPRRPDDRPVGRPSAVPRRPRGVHARFALAGARPPWTRSSPRASSRRSAAASSSRSGRRPRRTCSMATPRSRALGVIGALTFLGMAAGPFVGAAVLAGSIRPRRSPTSASTTARSSTSSIRPGAGCSTSTSRSGSSRIALAWAASAGWDTPGARPASTSAARSCSRSPWPPGWAAVSVVGSPPATAGGLDPFLLGVAAAAVALVAGVATIVRGAVTRTRSSTCGCSASRVFSSAASSRSSPASRSRRDRRWRAVRRPGPVRRPGRAAGRARRARRRDGGRCPRLGVRDPGPAAAARLAGRAGRLGRWRSSRWAAGPRRRPDDGRRRSSPLFGLGFGLTVTPRSTAAVEAAGRRCLRDGVGDRDRRPDDRHGHRPVRARRLRLDGHRPPLRPGLWHARRRTRRSSPSSCATGR